MKPPFYKGNRHLSDSLILASVAAPYVAQAHIKSSLEVNDLKLKLSKFPVEMLSIAGSEAAILNEQIMVKVSEQIAINMAALDVAWDLVRDADVFISHKKRLHIARANEDVSPSVEFKRVLFNAEDLHKKGVIHNSKDLRTFKLWLFRALKLIHPEIDKKQFWKRVLKNDKCVDGTTLAMIETLRTETKRAMTHKLNAKKTKSGNLPK